MSGHVFVQASKARARSNASRSIFAVSFPVEVFCFARMIGTDENGSIPGPHDMFAVMPER